MKTIITLNKISPLGLDIFDTQKYVIDNDSATPDGIMVRSASMLDRLLPTSLLAIARAGAGVNNIPVEKCSEQGIVVFNTPGANANAVKELVLFGLFVASRKIGPALLWAQTLCGDDVAKQVEKGKSDFVGPEVFGKKLGVIGLGAIGVQVANAAMALGMEVYGYDPYLSVDAAWQLSRGVHHATNIREVYENCDYITLHLPLNANTKEMINAEALKKMKHGVRILNFARGELVENEDMLAAIAEKQVCCYVTDFPCEKLLHKDGVIAIPHLGASTPESEENCAIMAAQQLVDYLENGNIKNSVNFPDVIMPRMAGTRLGILHKNVPAMISGISSAVSVAGLNIANLTNKSKKDLAYTMIDVEGAVSDVLTETIQKIDGVIKVNIYR